MDPAVQQRCADMARDLTIPALLHRNATEFPDLPALSLLGSAGTLTWRQLRDEVAVLARGLADLGLGSGDRLLIMMSGRPEHWLIDLAAASLGAIPSTVYATLSTDQLRYLARHSKAGIVVLEDDAALERWQPVLDEVPQIRRVVVADRAASDPEGRIISLRHVSIRGAAAHQADPGAFEKTWREVRPEQPVTLLYTSGTTGDPKGVVLTHHNVLYQCVVMEHTIDTPDHAGSLAYLPLAHIAERILGIYNPIYRAGHVTICPDPAQLLAGLVTVRPVSFFGVPRIWEKMVAGVQGQLAAADPAVRAAVDAARAVATEVHRLREAGRPVPDELAARHAALDAQVLRPLRARLGLDNLRWAGSGAAPIPVAVLFYLASIGIDVLEVWGMTETTGTATINTPESFRTGSVGRANGGMEIRLAGDGEILVRGPLVSAGYLSADGGIEPITDADGWLATGDVGVLDDDGFLTITDRKKELIINSSGKNISPAQIENLLRAHPLIAQAVAVGDRRPYVTALIVLDEEIAPLWARSKGLPATTVAELADDPALRAEIDAAVAAANSRLSRPEQVKTYRVLARGWSPETGELTPTLKLRRRIIHDRYADEIGALYG
ncbi:long-chain acyl-CoA synthetase [Actinoplanes philippinensis]|uniref:Acyl-CoA synthetase n=1 Tax=Actinoplanes philippinensis TaxID=35752 RepID=A0A1I2HBM1_9ACTN|nr:AMP-dependent synthetase/ligase [Actinoplanes philippinensis]GIE81670.1 long-chain acyl-CoA synthetase [Actinoplanes philippinensis]SFF27574.1 long-chain acyl-CoA synthetase [Actinoplanes philippinensis]